MPLSWATKVRKMADTKCTTLYLHKLKNDCGLTLPTPIHVPLFMATYIVLFSRVKVSELAQLSYMGQLLIDKASMPCSGRI